MMHFRHGKWVDNDGEPIELTDYAPEIPGREPAAEDTAESKPKRTRSAKKDPREDKGAQ